MIPYDKMFISCVLEDIDPILPHFHFMFLDRYWSHITKFPSRVCDRYWSHSQFSKNIKRTFGIIRPCLFHDFQDFSFHVLEDIDLIFKISTVLNGSLGFVGRRLLHFRNCCFPKFENSQDNIFENNFGSFLICLRYLGVSKMKYNWFWQAWSRPPALKIMKIVDCRVFQNEAE